MSFRLRWEALPLHAPYGQPDARTLLPPIASGLLSRDGTDAAALAPSDPIALPQADEQCPFLLLLLTAVGNRDWIISLGTQASPPSAVSKLTSPFDPQPCIWVPTCDRLGITAQVRTVRSGAVFIATPWT